jgi:two-component system chemotaxis response regulator CheB
LEASLISVNEINPFPEARVVRTLVVDDFVSMHEAIATCLRAVTAVEVVGTALNGREALEKIPILNPDLAIVDLQMPVMDGFQLMRRLRSQYPRIKVVAVCGHASEAIEREALIAGAHAFVSKAAFPQDLVNKVQALLPE